MGRVWAEEDEERGADRMRNNVTRLDLHNTEEANDGNDIQRRKKNIDANRPSFYSGQLLF